ncbi:hypothetical protein [Paraburkholderia hospita]|uniref:hypothetical protein n=1 Tax=Paraburkholderia hospita TaxID=169430 RepID=UPI003BF9E71B
MVDHFTYGIVSDGDPMEGCRLRSGFARRPTRQADLSLRRQSGPALCGQGYHVFRRPRDVLKGYGWHIQTIDDDGNDLAAIEQALDNARAETHRPSLLLVRTHLGYGSSNRQISTRHTARRSACVTGRESRSSPCI